MSVRCMLIEPSRGTATEIDEAQQDQWLQEPPDDGFIWIDVNEPDERDDDRLAEMGVHPLALQDAQRQRHPPKFEQFGAHRFTLLKDLVTVGEALECRTCQSAQFVFSRALVTRCYSPPPSVKGLWNDVLVSPDLAGNHPDELSLRLMRRLADRYLAVLIEFEEQIEVLERDALESPTDALLTRLTNFRTNLKRMRRIFTYHEQAIADLRASPHDPEIDHQLNDVAEQFVRVSSLATLHHDITSELAEGVMAMMSHRLNGIMKVLTVVTVIFVPLSFMAGVYGMNFEYMPELSARNAYFTLLSVMGLVAVSLIGMFRWKRWI